MRVVRPLVATVLMVVVLAIRCEAGPGASNAAFRPSGTP